MTVSWLVSAVKIVSDDIDIDFGQNKYAKNTFNRGKKVYTEEIQ